MPAKGGYQCSALKEEGKQIHQEKPTGEFGEGSAQLTKNAKAIRGDLGEENRGLRVTSSGLTRGAKQGK